MADIRKPDDLILPLPETQRDTDLNKTLQDYTKSLNDTFSDLEDIEAIDAGDGITDTDNTFSINVDGTSVELNGSDQLSVIDGGVDHDSLANTHNLTTDIDHDTITNNHNLTTDIDHDALTNFTATEHFTMIDDDSFATASSTTAATSESIKAYVDDNIPTSALTFVGTESWSNTTSSSYITIGSGKKYLVKFDVSAVDASDQADFYFGLDTDISSWTSIWGFSEFTLSSPMSIEDDDTTTGSIHVIGDDLSGIYQNGWITGEMWLHTHNFVEGSNYYKVSANGTYNGIAYDNDNTTDYDAHGYFKTIARDSLTGDLITQIRAESNVNTTGQFWVYEYALS